jgi:glycosyltransferase involved in cell wall biosynthesis
MTLRVAIISGTRAPLPMGFGIAERNLLEELRRDPRQIDLRMRVFGGRGARRYAKALGGVWLPARPGRAPRRAARGVDLVHALGLEARPPASTPYVITVHDLAGIRYPDEEALPSWSGAVLRNARRVLTPSRFSKQELVDLLDLSPERVVVIGTGLGLTRLSDAVPLADSELHELDLRRPVVLRMGGYTDRKNISVLLEAWPALRAATSATLVLTGPVGPIRDAALRGAAGMEGLRVLDYPSGDLLARLLRSADVLVSTSLYEGAGLPPLEAMAAGVPVVAVRAGATEEFCGDAALLVDNDPDELAAAVERVLGDPGRRVALAQAGMARAANLSWHRVADRVADAYRVATGDKSNSD